MPPFSSLSRRARVAIALVGLVAVLALLLLGVALQRYGGAEGVVLRARVALAQQERQRQMQPAFAPTPLPTPTGQPALSSSASSAAPAATAETTDAPATTAAVPAPLATKPFAQAENAPDLPTATPTATATPTPLPPTATPTSPPPVANPGIVYLSGVTHYWQTWNNCGPATLAMTLSYYGLPLTQKQTAAVLKPFWDDKNVSPAEMAAFARSQGLTALVRVNGEAQRLRRYVDAGIPVLIETWLEHDGGMGHYRLVVGYDDAAQEWIVYDTYVSDGVKPNAPYVGIRMSYADLNRLWRVFNGTYVLIYDAAHAAAAQEILGEDSDDAGMWQRSLARAEADTAAAPGDAFAWFNLGTSLNAQARYGEAASAFDQARVIGLPWRMLWYQFEPLQAYYEAGRHDELLALVDAVIGAAGNIEESFYWRGRSLQARGDLEGARQAYRRAVELRSNYAEAAQALAEVGG